ASPWQPTQFAVYSFLPVAIDAALAATGFFILAASGCVCASSACCPAAGCCADAGPLKVHVVTASAQARKANRALRIGRASLYIHEQPLQYNPEVLRVQISHQRSSASKMRTSFALLWCNSQKHS